MTAKKCWCGAHLGYTDSIPELCLNNMEHDPNNREVGKPMDTKVVPTGMDKALITSGDWAIHVAFDGSEGHLIPINDGVAHTMDAGCICGPTLEIVEESVELTDDVEIAHKSGFFYSHHALDGRS